VDDAINDPAARASRYSDLIKAYCDRVTDQHFSFGESFHFALFSGDEPLAEAMIATERMIAEEGGFRAGERVLDVGCGVGGPALTIAEASGAHVTGINIVEHQVELARERAAARGLAERVTFTLGDAMRMPFGDGEFDHVYALEAGCHLPDKALFHRECARVLRPGGLFVGLDWMRTDGLSAEDEERYIKPICRYNSIPHLISLSELKRYLADAGLIVELIEDASVRGDILRNWEILDEETIASLRAMPVEVMPQTLQVLTGAGIALAEGARRGAFVIGHWKARKAID
jgi:SAM-dependent methyltransferase